MENSIPNGYRRMLGMPGRTGITEGRIGYGWNSRWESLPTLPACISFWNSYKFWNNIPQNNNRRGKNKKVITNQPNQPNPPKGKKKKNFPKSFALESLGIVRKAQNSQDEKEPKADFLFVFLCLSRFGNYQRFRSLFQAESKEKKWELSRSNSPFPAKFWEAADP